MLVPTVNGVVVLLPSHADDDLCTPTRHYHCDTRFGSRQVNVAEGEVVWVDLEPIASGEYTIPDDFLWLIILRQGYGKRDVCGVCPHRGIRLEGRTRCPAHGLPPGVVAEDVTIELRAYGPFGVVIGGVRLVDCVLNTCSMGIVIDVQGKVGAIYTGLELWGTWPGAAGGGIRLQHIGKLVSRGDTIKLNYSVKGD